MPLLQPAKYLYFCIKCLKHLSKKEKSMSYRHSAPSHALHTAGLYLALLAALCLTACTRPAAVPELDTADSLME